MKTIDNETLFFIEIFKITEKYLKEKCKGINLEKYYKPNIEFNVIKNNKINNKKIFQRLIISMNEKGSGKARIKNQTEGPDFENDNSIKRVLCDYEYKNIINTYKKGYQELEKALINKAKFRKNKNTERFAHGVYSAAQLFSDEKIIEKIKYSYRNDIETNALIEELNSIYNIGYALACDFIKESGYDNWVKPDTHVIDVCGQILKILYFRNEKYEVIPKEETCLEIIRKIANANKTTCYQVDKMFWLIGSNNFYLDKDNKNGKGIKMSKKEFFAILKTMIN